MCVYEPDEREKERDIASGDCGRYHREPRLPPYLSASSSSDSLDFLSRNSITVHCDFDLRCFSRFSEIGFAGKLARSYSVLLVFSCVKFGLFYTLFPYDLDVYKKYIYQFVC